MTAVLSPARTFLGRFALLGVVVVGLGATVAWLISRNITRPVIRLSSAATTIAEGDYSPRVEIRRNDEIGRLAAAFNVMAMEVAESRAQLETRVAQRTSELEKANREIAETQQRLVRREKLAMLGQLASGVGHELRNPLGVMTNAVFYLETVITDPPEPVREYLGILRDQVRLSEKIISDLLDMARVHDPRTESLSLGELVRAQLERLDVPSNVEVEVALSDSLPKARADRTQIGQVVLNLLANAIQAIPEDRTGRIEVRGRVEPNGRVRLEIGDDGRGIEPDALETIFEPLYTTRAQGIGLGLAISRLLAERNGGTLTAVSDEGDGSTFFLTLPGAEAGT